MAINYTLPTFQTTQDAQVPTGVIQTPTTPTNVYSTPTVDQIAAFGAQFDAAGPSMTPEMQKVMDSNAQYEALLGIQNQAAKEQAQQFASLGGDAAKAKLASITAQYNAADIQNQAEQQAYLQQTRNIGGYTQTAQTGGMEDINRANAVKKLNLAAEAAILTGNIDQAKTLSEQSIKAKYGDVQTLIDQNKALYERNKDMLSNAEKKAAEKKNYILAQQQKELDKKIADEKAISDMIVEATPNAPTSVIANARKLAESGASRLAVAQSLGVYGGDYLKTQLLKAQIDTEKAQKAKYYADIDKIKSEMITKGLPATTQNIAKVEASQSVYDLANELKTLAGKGGAVGFGIKKSIVGSIPFVEGTAIAGTERANYEAKFKQLKDTLASANLDKLKGAMSDKDIEFLRNIGTALSLDMSEESFDKELEKVAQTMANVPGVQKTQPKPASNPFMQSLGIQPGNYSGTSIISNVNDNGDINFSIPK